MYNGYDFYFANGDDVLLFPITPGELSIKVGSNNKVVSLIDGGDINILKSPSLIEVEFEARFPMFKYPYTHKLDTFQNYYDKFKEFKEDKVPFRFIVARNTPLHWVTSNNKNSKTQSKTSWDTNLLMALEEFELQESADEGDDVIISFKLKQYKKFGTKKLKRKDSKPTTTSTSSASRSTTKKTTKTKTKTKNKTYTVKSGDCLWNIAKKFYGSGSKWKTIYNANKSAIEKDAKKHGKKSSSNGHWIWPGLKLTIPSE